LQIEPKCFNSGYKPAGKVIPLKFNLNVLEFQTISSSPLMGKVAVVVRTLVRIGCKRTEVRATFV